MIAYKGTTNLKSINFTYEVGKTYTIQGEIKACKQGFHFCKNIQDINDYYGFGNNNLIYYEGPNDYWKKQNFDKNNNLIYIEDSNKYWYKQEFDQNNKFNIY